MDLSSATYIQDFEYYDYVNYGNRTEVLNDYASALASTNEGGSTTNGAAAHALLTDMKAALGNMQTYNVGGSYTAASGFTASMLTRPLTRSYTPTGGTAMHLSDVTSDAFYQTSPTPVYYATIQALLRSFGCS